MGEEENIEFIPEKQEPKAPKDSKKGSVRDFLDGSILIKDFMVKQLPFIIFITVLAIIYIGNRYHAEKVYRKHLLIQNELKEMRAEAITTASELMFMSKQSMVVRLVEEEGLNIKEAKVPPKRIIVKKRKYRQ